MNRDNGYAPSCLYDPWPDGGQEEMPSDAQAIAYLLKRHRAFVIEPQPAAHHTIEHP